MVASSFGLPIPEELVLVSVGLIAHMAHNPHLYPPPEVFATPTNVTTLAIVCFLAVFLSDVLIYLIGRTFGGRLLQSAFFQRRIKGKTFDKINDWFRKYGGLACGVFRFTPGLRFTGHLSCGLLGVPLWKFLLIDGLAALISVPTQIFIIAKYGDIVISTLKEVKGALLIVVVILVAFYFIRKKKASLKTDNL